MENFPGQWRGVALVLLAAGLGFVAIAIFAYRVN